MFLNRAQIWRVVLRVDWRSPLRPPELSLWKTRAMRLKSFISVGILLLSCGLAATASGQEARKIIAKPTPVYPEIAKRMGLSGTVKSEILIAADGQVKSTTVIGGHPVLVSAALEALKKWKYEPGKTETTVSLRTSFTRISHSAQRPVYDYPGRPRCWCYMTRRNHARCAREWRSPRLMSNRRSLRLGCRSSGPAHTESPAGPHGHRERRGTEPALYSNHGFGTGPSNRQPDGDFC